MNKHKGRTLDVFLAVFVGLGMATLALVWTDEEKRNFGFDNDDAE